MDGIVHGPPWLEVFEPERCWPRPKSLETRSLINNIRRVSICGGPIWQDNGCHYDYEAERIDHPRGAGEVCGDGLAGSHVAVVVVPGAQRGGTRGTQLWCEA